MSLVHSARINGHGPHLYLKDVMERPPTQPASESASCCPIAGYPQLDRGDARPAGQHSISNRLPLFAWLHCLGVPAVALVSRRRWATWLAFGLALLAAFTLGNRRNALLEATGAAMGLAIGLVLFFVALRGATALVSRKLLKFSGGKRCGYSGSNILGYWRAEITPAGLGLRAQQAAAAAETAAQVRQRVGATSQRETVRLSDLLVGVGAAIKRAYPAAVWRKVQLVNVNAKREWALHLEVRERKTAWVASLLDDDATSSTSPGETGFACLPYADAVVQVL